MAREAEKYTQVLVKQPMGGWESTSKYWWRKKATNNQQTQNKQQTKNALSGGIPERHHEARPGCPRTLPRAAGGFRGPVRPFVRPKGGCDEILGVLHPTHRGLGEAIRGFHFQHLFVGVVVVIHAFSFAVTCIHSVAVAFAVSCSCMSMWMWMWVWMDCWIEWVASPCNQRRMRTNKKKR